MSPAHQPVANALPAVSREFEVTCLADIEAIERVPLLERLPHLDLYAALADSARRHAAEVAIRFLPDAEVHTEPQEIRYAELLDRIHQAANLFHCLGVSGKTPVSFLLSNLPETHYCIWGGEVAGAINALNPNLEVRHLAAIMRTAGSTVLVVEDRPEVWDKLASLIGEVPALKHVLVIASDIDWRQRTPATTAVKWLDFRIELASYSSERLTFSRQVKPTDVLAYFHTGGTTGTPKLAPQHHLGQLYIGYMFGHLLGMAPGKNVFCGLPLFHVNGVMLSGLVPFLAGASVTLLTPAGFRDKQVVANFWELVARYRATAFSTVPTVLGALLNVPISVDISCMEFCLCGAAPMTTELYRRFVDSTGVQILEGYGLTESHCVATAAPLKGEQRIGSVGLRFPYLQLKAVRLDEQGVYLGDCQVDEPGVIVLRGSNIFPGYLGVEAGQGCFIEGDWFNTGDLGHLDADGYVWLSGRVKDLIIRGGHNIDPALIEEALARHPAVQAVAAVGRPDVYAGEIPVAYVQLQAGSQVTGSELQAFAREQVPERAAVPDWVEVITALPVTAVGKISKVTLRERASERVLREALFAVGIPAAVMVQPNERSGSLAVVAVAEVHRQLAVKVLEQFTLSYRLEITEEVSHG